MKSQILPVRAVITLIICISAMLLAIPVSALTPLEKAKIQDAQAERLDIANQKEKLIAGQTATNLFLEASREQLRDTREDARALLAQLKAIQRELESQIDELGPAPSDIGVHESEAIANRRQGLVLEQGEIAALVAQSEFTVAFTDRLIDEITEMQQNRFFEEIFTHGPLPIHPQTFLDALHALKDDLARVGHTARSWWASIDTQGQMLRIIVLISIIIIALFAVVIPFRRWLSRKVSHFTQTAEPSEQAPILSAGLRITLRLLPTVFLLLITILSIRYLQVSLPAKGILAESFIIAFLLFVYAEAFSYAVLAPFHTRLRLVNLTTANAFRVYGIICLIAGVYALHTVIRDATLVISSSIALSSVQAAIAGAIIAVLLWLLSQQRLWVRPETAGQTEVTRFTVMGPIARFALSLLSLFILAGSALGYVALTDFVLSKMIMFAALLSGIWLLRAIVRTLLEDLPLLRQAAPVLTAQAKTTEEGQENFFLFWVLLTVDVVLLMIITPPLLFMFGVDWQEVLDLGRQAIYGFTIGNVTISIAEFAYALIAFVIVLVTTRLIQKTLDKKIFPRTRLNIGVRNSFVTLIGYVGLVIAGFFAIRTLGVDLSNLAIIAGALSVGIGFGLQSIVNNFVSGLILLFERPIKVGDWIVTGAGEGTVKRISVRSTEIETFDRCSIIVPNSELISSPVKNWTHKDKLGRVIVRVGVSYDSDPEQVRDILLKAAKNHPLTLSYPAPMIYWADFGASSLDFEVRVFIRDISNVLLISNDLRFAIFSALKEAGIEIPFPQTDIHIKSPELLTDRIEQPAEMQNS